MLDRLADAGARTAVVNVHYFAEERLIQDYLRPRAAIRTS